MRRMFETVLGRCVREGLVGGEAFVVDASLIKADANRQNVSKVRRATAKGDRPGAFPSAALPRADLQSFHSERHRDYAAARTQCAVRRRFSHGWVGV